MYLNLATVAALPVKCSRHNTPSRCHAITRLVQSCSVGVDESIVVSRIYVQVKEWYSSNNFFSLFLQIVCEKNDVYASGCAVARAFPLYSKKTSSGSNENVTVSVEFIIVPGSSGSRKCNALFYFFLSTLLTYYGSATNNVMKATNRTIKY